MGQEGVATVNDMGNGVDLMGQELDLRVNAGKNEVATVIFAGPGAVHFLVVLPHQGLTALRVLPNPIPKGVPQSLLLLRGKGRFSPVQYPLLFIVLASICCCWEGITGGRKLSCTPVPTE